MNFPTPEQAAKIRMAKAKLETNVNKLLAIFGPYEKRLADWYISGGCMASILREETPKDYDIYFRNEEVMNHVVALITGSPDLMQHVADRDENYRDVMGKDGKCITENAITMKNGLQFITRHYGNVRDTFDFVHCMPIYTFDDHRLRISEEQYDCCVRKILKVNCKENVTDKRTQKFIDQGYAIPNEITIDNELMQIIEDKVGLTNVTGNEWLWGDKPSTDGWSAWKSTI